MDKKAHDLRATHAYLIGEIYWLATDALGRTETDELFSEMGYPTLDTATMQQIHAEEARLTRRKAKKSGSSEAEDDTTLICDDADNAPDDSSEHEVMVCIGSQVPGSEGRRDRLALHLPEIDLADTWPFDDPSSPLAARSRLAIPAVRARKAGNSNNTGAKKSLPQRYDLVRYPASQASKCTPLNRPPAFPEDVLKVLEREVEDCTNEATQAVDRDEQEREAAVRDRGRKILEALVDDF